MPSNDFDIAHSMCVSSSHFIVPFCENVERCMNALSMLLCNGNIFIVQAATIHRSRSLFLYFAFDLFICYTCTKASMLFCWFYWNSLVIRSSISFFQLCCTVARIQVVKRIKRWSSFFLLFLSFTRSHFCVVLVLYNLYFYVCVLKSINDSNQKQVRSRKPRKVQIQFCFGIVTFSPFPLNVCPTHSHHRNPFRFGGVWGAKDKKKSETNVYELKINLQIRLSCWKLFPK